MRFLKFFVLFVCSLCFVCGSCVYAFENEYIRSGLQERRRDAFLRISNFANFIIFTMAYVSDSECIKAAEAVEKLDRELDELQQALDGLVQPTKGKLDSESNDFDALAAWLEGLTTMPEPSTWPKTPANFNELLTKPVEQSWLDERTMNSFEFLANQEDWGGSTSASPTTISSGGSSAIPTTSFTTPKRPPPEHNARAPKKCSQAVGAVKCRRYSRWSKSRLQTEFIERFQPQSQKHLDNIQFMADALTYDDREKTYKTPTTSQPSTSSQSSLISQPATKKQRSK